MSRRGWRWTPRARTVLLYAGVALWLIGVVSVAIVTGVLTGNVDPP